MNRIVCTGDHMTTYIRRTFVKVDSLLASSIPVAHGPLAEQPENRCIMPLTVFCKFTPEKPYLDDGKPQLKGEMWVAVPTSRVRCRRFLQQTREGNAVSWMG